MLPTVPTDNLFKFLAVGGLALAAFCVWADGDMDDRLKSKEVVARTQYIEFVSEFEDKSNEMATSVQGAKKDKVHILLSVPDANGKQVRLAPGTQFPLVVDTKGREQHRFLLSYFDNFLASTTHADSPHESNEAFTPEIVKNLRGKLREHGATVETLWSQADRYSGYRRLGTVGTWAGFLASLIGFAFWIFGQKRSDQLERVKLDKERRDLDSAASQTGEPVSPASIETPAPSQCMAQDTARNGGTAETSGISRMSA